LKVEIFGIFYIVITSILGIFASGYILKARMTGSRRPDFNDRAVVLRIRALRQARGLSQVELGRLIGVTFQQVQKYETAANRIGAGRLARIAEIFDVPLTALFGPAELRRNAAADPFEALHTAGAVRLLQAYGGIRSATVRRAFVRLAEETAAGGV
jgi:transcriptional regulator with XRE-family HTH domain